MAKNTGRIVIWSILGVAVVVTAVLLLTADRGGTKPVNVPSFTRTMERRLGRLERDVSDLRGHYGPGSADVFAEIDQHVASAREKLQRMQTTTDQPQLALMKDEVYDHYRASRNLLEALE